MSYVFHEAVLHPVRTGVVHCLLVLGACLTILSPLGLPTSQAASRLSVASDSAEREAVAPASLSMQPAFTSNTGQWHSDVAFRSSAAGAQVFVTQAGELVYALTDPPSPTVTDTHKRPVTPVSPNIETDGWSLVETFVEGHPSPSGASIRPQTATWFVGEDAYHTEQYEQVSLGEVWPGIHVDVHQRGDTQEKLFTLAPGAGVEQIKVQLDGATAMATDAAGQLVLQTGRGTVTFSAPVAYQETPDGRAAVEVAYAVTGSQYGFTLGKYDDTVPLIIDPLINVTFAGGSGEDQFFDTLFLPDGSLYAVGTSSSADFPGTSGGAQASLALGSDGIIARYSSDLRRLEQVTYLGGDGDDALKKFGVLPDASGNVTGIVVVGETTSTDFPGTAGSADPSYNGNRDAVVALLNTTLTTLTRATYFGGANADYATSVAVTSSDSVVIAGGTESPGLFSASSPDATYDGGGDGFLVAFSNTLQSRHQPGGMYAGGTGDDVITGVTHLRNAGVYASGYTNSPEFMAAGDPQFSTSPKVYGSLGGYDIFAFQYNRPRIDCCGDIFRKVKIGGPGDDRAYTMEGGGGLSAGFFSGFFYVTGETSSVGLGTQNALQPAYGGGSSDGFVLHIEMDDDGAEVDMFSYVGGSGADSVWTLTGDHLTGAFIYTIGGQTTSPDLPTSPHSFQPTYGGGIDGFLLRATLYSASNVDRNYSQLIRMTYLGGSGDDIVYAIKQYGYLAGVRQGSDISDGIFVAGQTSNGRFLDTTAGAQPRIGGGADGFVARLSRDLGTTGTIPVNRELALLLDSSGSILSKDWKLQLDAYKTFFSQPNFYRDYVAPFGNGRIAVAAYNFSAFVRRDIDWTLIDSQAAAEAFAAQFTPANVPRMGFDTELGSVLDQAGLDLMGNAYDGHTAIDLASDGIHSGEGVFPHIATQLNQARGVDVINVLGIGDFNRTVLEAITFGTNQNGRPAFEVYAADLDDFAGALHGKLANELLPEPVGVIGGQVWEDRYQRGRRDTIDPTRTPPMAGIVVRLQNSAGSTLASTVTASNGTYHFAGLVQGTYMVVFEAPSGYHFTYQHRCCNPTNDSDADADGRTDNIVLAPGQFELDIDAGLVLDPNSIVGGRVWHDTNYDGVRADDEPPMGGIPVRLQNSTGKTLASITTASDGRYRFDELVAGEYVVTFDAPPAYGFSPQYQGDDEERDSDADSGGTATVSADLDEADVTIDAGLVVDSGAVIGGQVWNDTNRDGLRADDEPPMAGLLVRLQNSTGATLASTTSAADGSYRFTGLAARTYMLAFEAPPRYRFTLLYQGDDWYRDSDAFADGTTESFPMAADEIDLTWDAGLYRDDTTAVGVRYVLAKHSNDGDGHIVITWETGAELNVAGFSIWRSATGNRAEAARITSERIAARGTGQEGATYEWTDRHVVPEKLYTYWLEQIDADGATHEFGPVRTITRMKRLWLPQVSR